MHRVQGLIAFLLVVLSLPGFGRQIPTVPMEISAADRSQLLAALGVDEAQVRYIVGFREVRVSNARSGAEVSLSLEPLGDRIARVREFRCIRREDGWGCGRGRELIHARLPGSCGAVGIESSTTGYLRVLLDNDPAMEHLPGILGAICQAQVLVRLTEETGHRLAYLRRSVDDELELGTRSADVHPWGWIYVIEQQCGTASCRWVITARGGWDT